MATDRLQGLNIGTAVKPPCYVASTASLTLSSTQVVDGIAVGSCERVLAKDQTDPKLNGIYIADTAAWRRAPDFDGSRDAVPGTLVFVDRGTANGAAFYAFNSSSTAVNINIGSTGDDIVLTNVTNLVSGFSLTTEGDLATHDGSTQIRLAIGASGTVLVASTRPTWEAVSADYIASSAVTAAKIADGAVSSTKIAASAVSSTYIADSAVQSTHVADLAGIGASLVLIATANPSSDDVSADFISGIGSTYDRYVVTGNVRPNVVNGLLRMRTSTDGGTNWGSSTSYSHYSENRQASAQNTADAAINLTPNAAGGGIYGSTDGGANITLFIDNIASTSVRTAVYPLVAYIDSILEASFAVGSGFRRDVQAENGIQILFSSSNFQGGSLSLYGVRSS